MFFSPYSTQMLLGYLVSSQTRQGTVLLDTRWTTSIVTQLLKNLERSTEKETDLQYPSSVSWERQYILQNPTCQNITSGGKFFRTLSSVAGLNLQLLQQLSKYPYRCETLYQVLYQGYYVPIWHTCTGWQIHCRKWSYRKRLHPRYLNTHQRCILGVKFRTTLLFYHCRAAT